MKKALSVLAALAVLSPFALSACGGDDNGSNGSSNGASNGATPAPAPATAIKVEGKEFEFLPDTIEVTAGEPFVIEFTNVGLMEHDFVIEGVDVEPIYALPGESASSEFTLAAGTYTFYCTIPGHREAGMFGTLIAK